jgi:hypothetical protein
MNSSLSFRKESIQRSSSASGTLSHPSAGLLEAQGQRHAGEQFSITITTSLTTV